MNKTIHAVFENGVFRPIESVDLPERSEVEFEPRLVAKNDKWPDGYFQQTAGTFAEETLSVFHKARCRTGTKGDEVST